MTEVASYVHLLNTCQAGQSTLPLTLDQTPAAAVGEEVGQASPIHFTLTSLFAKSSICAITMTAFSEGTSPTHYQTHYYCT